MSQITSIYHYGSNPAGEEERKGNDLVKIWLRLRIVVKSFDKISSLVLRAPFLCLGDYVLSQETGILN